MSDATNNTFHPGLGATGLSTEEIRTMVRNGALQRLRRGVYVIPEATTPELQHRKLIHAGHAVVADSNVVSHISAAVLYGLPVPRSRLERVTMTRVTPGHGEQSARLIVRHTKLDEDEVTLHAGMRVTTLARTVFDLARSLPFEWGVMACDAALHEGLDRTMLTWAIERHPKLKGVPRARLVAAAGDGRSESPAESLSRVQMTRVGLPTPELQYELFDADGVFVARTDFAWPAVRLVGEVDGRAKYDQLLRPGQSPADAIMAEKRREEAIRQQGMWVVRWDWDTAWRPDELAARIRRAMQWQASTS